MDNRHRDALSRLNQAEEARGADGGEPYEFHLLHTGGMQRHIDHPTWDPSWATPSEHTIDDLEDLGYLRVTNRRGKARSFIITMRGKSEARALSKDTGSGIHVPKERASDTGAGGDGAALNRDGRDPRKVAVMHGRDMVARKMIFDLLRRLGLEPLEWDELVDRTGSASPYNGDAVAAAFAIAQAVVVVFTPDDIGLLHPDLQGDHEREDDRAPTGQPRLNVVLEAGMALQSHPDQTIIVEIGRTREISDLAGRNTVRLDGTPSRFNALASRLEGAKCLVARAGSDWLDTEEFVRLAALGRDASAFALERKSRGDAPASRKAPPNVRLTLLTFKRTGEDLRGTNIGPYISAAAVETWTQQVVTFLNEHVSPDTCERFMTAGDVGPPGDRLVARVAVIDELIQELAQASSPDEAGSATLIRRVEALRADIGDDRYVELGIAETYNALLDAAGTDLPRALPQQPTPAHPRPRRATMTGGEMRTHLGQVLAILRGAD